ncbi:MAG: LpqB family beta-propeller domain-containing protein [Gordonia sp. (in: high G+C Gram-positive bacteria)]|uniref:LpqB family beta-propeller domain-containing protein n=1 Tax=Gordonia sp. (in: high G+C Gram-positive bacteria) TaxID=84139 RepID=UPI0039E5C68E
MMRRIRAAALAVVVALGTAGCVAIPTDSSPQPLKTFERRPAAQAPARPTATMDPEALVHGFLRATADPTAAHSAARAFLTPENAARWDDRGDTTVLGNISVVTESRTDNEATVRITGDNTASLKVNGQLLPATGRVETTMRLTRTPTGWRIDGPLPQGVHLDRAQFDSTFRLATLYFTDHEHRRLVGDPRWFFVGQLTASSVAARLLAGPSLDLVRATASAIPAKAELGDAGRRDQGGGVRIDLKNAGSPSDQDRELMAAQLVWTLSSADSPAPYVITLDGQPLLPKHADGIRLADVQKFSPTAADGNQDRLDVISDGQMSTVEGTALKPVGGGLNDGKQVVSANVSPDRSRVAAVRGPRPDRPAPGAPPADPDAAPPADDARSQLVSGPYGGAVATLATGATITRPSFGANGDLWAVVDGKPTRWGPDARPTVADIEALDAVARGPIIEMQVSPDGVRAALIVAGQVLFAIIETAEDGRLVLAHPRFAAFNIGNRAVALDWSSPTTLVVARDAAETPVTQVPLSGLPAAGMVTGNLAPPVRAVAANLSATYVADTRGVLKLAPSTERGQTWEDVPAGKGPDMVPVVP